MYRTFGNEIGAIDQNSRYVAQAAAEHIRESIGTDWETDELIIGDWLGDCPQDLISYAAGEALGLSKLEKLIVAAEAAGDLWALGHRAILAGHVAKQQSDTPAALTFWRRGLDACEKISADNVPLEIQQSQEHLELVTLAVVSPANDPQDAPRIPRMLYLVSQKHLDRYGWLTAEQKHTGHEAPSLHESWCYAGILSKSFCCKFSLLS